MNAENSKFVMKEYISKRYYLATAPIGIAELFDKAIQLVQFMNDNNITKEKKINE